MYDGVATYKKCDRYKYHLTGTATSTRAPSHPFPTSLRTSPHLTRSHCIAGAPHGQGVRRILQGRRPRRQFRHITPGSASPVHVSEIAGVDVEAVAPPRRSLRCCLAAYTWRRTRAPTMLVSAPGLSPVSFAPYSTFLVPPPASAQAGHGGGLSVDGFTST